MRSSDHPDDDFLGRVLGILGGAAVGNDGGAIAAFGIGHDIIDCTFTECGPSGKSDRIFQG